VNETETAIKVLNVTALMAIMLATGMQKWRGGDGSTRPLNTT
jgi:hypothetical protein